MWQGARHLLTRLQATAAAAAAAGLGDFAAAKQQQQPAVGGVLYACELAGLPDLLQALQQWLEEANQQQQQQLHQQQDGDAKRRTRGIEAVAAGAGAAAAAAGVPAGLDDPAGEFGCCHNDCYMMLLVVMWTSVDISGNYTVYGWQE
jgi:hypothetical protein